MSRISRPLMDLSQRWPSFWCLRTTAQAAFGRCPCRLSRRPTSGGDRCGRSGPSPSVCARLVSSSRPKVRDKRLLTNSGMSTLVSVCSELSTHPFSPAFVRTHAFNWTTS